MRPQRMAIVGLAVALAAGGSAMRAEAQTYSIVPGYEGLATNDVGARCRNTNSDARQQELYVGKPSLLATATRGAVHGTWAVGDGIGGVDPRPNHIVFTYDAGTKLARATVSNYLNTFSASFTFGPPGTVPIPPNPMNYVKLSVSQGKALTTVVLGNLVVNTLPISGTAGGGGGDWQVKGLPGFTNFTIAADIYLTGQQQQPGAETNKVEIDVGYWSPPDSDAPDITFVAPGSACLNGPFSISAALADLTGVAGAEYSLNDGSWQPLQAVDGTFDETNEDVQISAGLTSLVGANTVCIRSTDAVLPPNVSQGDDCVTFTVDYNFDGGAFRPPVDMPPVVNISRAGQTVPVKWRLTDCSLVPVPIGDTASFAGLMSYPVNCETLEPIGDAIEEFAPGLSGLIYHGDGNWQFNWQTPKAYAGTCRVMYVEFDSTHASPSANFTFRK